MIRRFLIKVLVSAVAIWAADWLLSGFTVAGGVAGYALAGLALGTLNTFVRPVLKLLTLPIVWLTLGLFSIVINGFMLYFTAKLVSGITFAGLTALVLATLVVTVVNVLFEPGTDN